MDLKRPAVFLDRDGTLIEDRHYLSDPSQVVLTEGCVAGLRKLSFEGFVLVIVTNQSGIARGLMTQGQVDAVNRQLIRLLSLHSVAIDGIYLCPHGEDDGCRCRKPIPGMVEQATEQLTIDLARSWVVGDKCSDVILGRNVGARTVLISSCPTGTEAILDSCDATAVARNLSDAAAYVISHSVR